MLFPERQENPAQLLATQLINARIPREAEEQAAHRPLDTPRPPTFPQSAERLLHRVLRGLGRTRQPRDEHHERRPVPGEQCVERGGIVRGEAREQRRVGALIGF